MSDFDAVRKRLEMGEDVDVPVRESDIRLLLSEVDRLKAEVERLTYAHIPHLERAEKAEAELAAVTKDRSLNLGQALSLTQCEETLGAVRAELAAERERVERFEKSYLEMRRFRDDEAGRKTEAWTELAVERERAERLEKALLRIAEGNLGPASWQADYDAIKLLARLALRPAAPESTPRKP